MKNPGKDSTHVETMIPEREKISQCHSGSNHTVCSQDSRVICSTPYDEGENNFSLFEIGERQHSCATIMFLLRTMIDKCVVTKNTYHDQAFNQLLL
jgi:hypothetical protein